MSLVVNDGRRSNHLPKNGATKPLILFLVTFAQKYTITRVWCKVSLETICQVFGEQHQHQLAVNCELSVWWNAGQLLSVWWKGDQLLVKWSICWPQDRTILVNRPLLRLISSRAHQRVRLQWMGVLCWITPPVKCNSSLGTSWLDRPENRLVGILSQLLMFLLFLSFKDSCEYNFDTQTNCPVLWNL